jgi:DNA-binding MarR family transcriptional regulator
LTVADVRWLDEAEALAWESFQLMVARLTGTLARDLSAHSDLSYSDYVVLVVISGEPSGAMRLFELAHRLGWEKSRASHQVARMAERGLVEKRKCASDRRGAFVVMTDAGHDQLVAAAPSHVAAVRRVFVDRLSGEQLDHLARLAAEVLKAVDEEERRSCPQAASSDCPPGLDQGTSTS